MNMKIIISTIVTLYLMLMVSADSATPNELWTELLKNEEKEIPFETPNDLRSHLNNLSHYYAVVGRPRFGKRNYDQDVESLRNLKKYMPPKYWFRLARLLNVNEEDRY